MTGDPAPYTLRGLQDMLGVSRGVATRLVQAGFVTPARGPRNAYRFTFQDVVLLRAAHALQAAQIPPRRILRSLRRLRASLPHELPLSGLRITAVGNDIAVRDGGRHWSAESGQLLLDLEVAQRPGSVAFLAPARPAAHATPHAAPHADADAETAAADWLARGGALEHDDPAAAEAAYREALALAPQATDAWLNLGALLCEAGRCKEAVALYDTALTRCPDVALLHYNRAIALEDQQRWRDALAAYEACIRLQPDFADAHYNAALLHERLGQPRDAIRRLSAYRRLSRHERQ